MPEELKYYKCPICDRLIASDSFWDNLCKECFDDRNELRRRIENGFTYNQ